jgi:hypothetical protein
VIGFNLWVNISAENPLMLQGLAHDLRGFRHSFCSSKKLEYPTPDFFLRLASTSMTSTDN